MDKKQALEIAKKYAEVVAKEFDPKEVLLFGSYLDGTPHEYSDIDIAVIFDEYKDNDLWSATSRMYNICRDVNMYIEPHLMELKHDESGFAHHVQKIGKILYQKA